MYPITVDQYVRMSGVSKSYDLKSAVIDNLDLAIRKGEFLTLLGPSGSGKTTTLMLLAGFEEVDRGEIFLDGREISNVPPHRRDIGVVFQNYALFPNMTVSENLAFPLQARRQDKRAIEKATENALRMIQMWDMRDRFPTQLSGGQQQRVAVARAMIFQPRLILMDEPLGALDKQLREQMQREIKELHRTTSATIVYVTHDQDEALRMSDRIAVFNKGAIEQIAAPREVYDAPASPFVANFIGEMNWLDGQVADVGHDAVGVQVGPGVNLNCSARGDLEVGQKVRVAVRPEAIKFAAPTGASTSVLQATVAEIAYLGQSLKAKLTLNGGASLFALVPKRDQELLRENAPTQIQVERRDLIVFPQS